MVLCCPENQLRSRAIENCDIQPRLLRLKDAPRYLGLDKNTFNREVRPLLTEMRIGRAVLFDRAELDTWVEKAKTQYGHSPMRGASEVEGVGAHKHRLRPGETMRSLAKRIKEQQVGLNDDGS